MKKFRKYPQRVYQRLNKSGETVERLLRQVDGRTLSIENLQQGLDERLTENTELTARVRKDLHVFIRLAVLKEICPELVEALMPKLDLPSEGLEDLRRIFPAISYGYGLTMRAWVTDMVNELTQVCYSVSAEEIRRLSRENLKRSRGTFYEAQTHQKYLSRMFFWGRDGVPAAELIGLYEEFATHPEAEAWAKAQPAFWIEYLALLLEYGDQEKAAQVLGLYHEKHSDHLLHTIAPVAHLAWKMNLGGRMVEEAGYIWEHIKGNTLENTLFPLIAGRNVAVVGNGPQQLGRGTGPEIDAHELVVRFNHFSRDEQYRQDYGYRTDLWVIASLIDLPLGMTDVSETKAIFFSRNFYRRELLDRERNFMYDNIKRKVTIFLGLNAECADNLPQFRHHCVSTGIFMLSLVKAVNPYFSPDHIYGFSHWDHAVVEQRMGEHYFGSIPTEKQTAHDVIVEKKIMAELFDRPEKK